MTAGPGASRLVDGATIAAVATAPGAAGVGIVRLSGGEARRIAAALMGMASPDLEPRRVYARRLHDPRSGAFLDEAVVFWMAGPRSYTGEDTAELQVHGGRRVLEALLGCCLALGARAAEPGEFTRRAYLNGRLDLVRAEAVAELIAARTDRALRVAQEHLAGHLGAAVEEVRGELVQLLAEVEASIDFPDEELELPGAAWQARAGDLAGRLAKWARSYGQGRLLREGATVVLVGCPNAGKSSLLNALAGEERALVDPRPGTTRDVVEALVHVGGLEVKLVDMAGVRGAAQDELEARGVALGRARLQAADAVLLVVDRTRDMEEQRLAATLGEGQRRLVVLSKGDLPARLTGAEVASLGCPVVEVCAPRGEGLESLRGALAGLLLGTAGGGDAEEGLVVTSARQAEALTAASGALARATECAGPQEGLELLALELRTALEALAELVGETRNDVILDAIFSRFCLGK